MNRTEHTLIDADSLSALQLYETLSGSFDCLRIPENAKPQKPERMGTSVFAVLRRGRKKRS